MNKTLEELGLELDQKIPRDVVSLRDGGGGRKLSYLEGHYVIDRLNKVFGHINWSKEIIDVRQVSNTITKTNYKTLGSSTHEYPAYLVKVRLTVGFATPDGQFKTATKEGYGYGSDKSSQNAHELAIKEAVTDALKVAAKDLGMSMGLALYDKTQENVDDGDEERIEPIKRVEKPEVRDDKGTSGTSQAGIDAATPAKLEEAIKQYVKVAVAQKRLTIEEFKTRFGVEKVAQLSPEHMVHVLAELKAMTR